MVVFEVIFFEGNEKRLNYLIGIEIILILELFPDGFRWGMPKA